MLRPPLALALALMTTTAAAFDLQGHRGARGLAPENTLPAFARALSIGVTTLEMDAGLTEDGVVVIAHDRRLNPDIARGSDGRWLRGRTPAIRELTYRELQRYDVGRIRPGSDYSKRFPDQRRQDKVRVPTLEEVFELTRHARNAEVRFNIETKISPEAPEDTADPATFTRALIKVIRDNGMAGRTTIQSFDWRTLAIVREEAPEVAASYLTSQQQSLDNIEAGHREDSPWTAGVRFRDHGSVPKMVQAAGGKIWSPNYVDLTEAALKEAKALGLTVLPWTVNDRADIERLIDWGVDGLITDYPDRLREIMAAKSMPLPRATPVTP
ncbi:MAG TPA: glycerophosphodiester phosphodiesterase [Burkholderiales bacterium]|nr:glycerophosphodiester phosphodiesterase [Burkholderiales bacterium]